MIENGKTIKAMSDNAQSGRIDAFMDEEQQAHDLVEALTRLKNESDSYHAARGTLEDAGDTVAKLGRELAEAVYGLNEVTRILRTIGTSELVRTQGVATAEMSALRSELTGIRHTMADSISTQSSTLEAMTRDMRSASDQMAKEIHALRGMIVESQRAAKADVTVVRTDLASTRRGMDAAISTQNKTFAMASGELRSSLETSAQSVSSLRGLMLAGMGTLLVGIIAIVVVILMRG